MGLFIVKFESFEGMKLTSAINSNVFSGKYLSLTNQEFF